MSARLTTQERAWLLKMPAWTAVRGEDILRRIDGLVTDNALLRAENEQMRRALASLPAELLADLAINPRDLARVHVSKEHPE